MNWLARNTLYVVAVLFVVSISIAAVAERSPGDIDLNLTSPAAVPGHVLAPGHYILRRVNSDDPTTYEILRRDTLDFVTYVRVIPAERLQLGQPEIEFSAPDAAGVRMIQTWYGPGDTNGYHVVYSNKDVRRLDQIAQQENGSGSPAGLP